MKLGVSLPLTDIGEDPIIIRDFAQQAEELGYKHLAAADHVLGVNAKNRPHWGDRNTSDDCFHDPFVLFGFLAACTKNIEFTTQVLILPQRQAALVAKQAACLDVLSNGRFRFGIGVGWNSEEYTALNQNFNNRGIQKVTLQRIAKYGDGWVMIAWPPNEEALIQFKLLREYVKNEGRKPTDVGIEVWVSASGSPDEWRKELEFWNKAGVTHACLNNTFSRYQHTRIKEHSVRAHTDAIFKYMDTVADLIE